MQITVRAHSSLDEFLPLHAGFERVTLDLREGSTPSSLIDELSLPRHRVHLLYINEKLIPRDCWDILPLHDDDELALWPLLAGG